MEITITWRFILGIDISKQTLDLYLPGRSTGHGWSHQVPNTDAGFTELGSWLAAHGAARCQTVLVSEHTGRYGEHLLRWSTTAGWPHAPVKTTAPDKVGFEHHRKDDAYDAQGLADYGRRYADQLRLAEAPTPAVGQIKRLQAERRKMVDRRAALTSKLGEASAHDADMEPIIQMWEQQIGLLSEHIDQLEQRIRKRIASDPVLAARYQTLRTAPGMGKVLTPFWLSLFAGQQTLDPRKIASRFGFAPHPHSSGSSVGKPDRSSGHGNPEMRRVLHQAARSVATHSPHYRDYYNRKIQEGKHPLVAINNIINKLIRLYCALWNNRAAYDPDYIQKNKHRWKKSA